MTNKETKQAIAGFTEFFKGITGNQDMKIPNDLAKKYGIEQEPCDDAISREKANQFLYERLDRLNDDELYDIFSKVIDDMYNELPSITPTQRWIPVSERLPEEYGEYLVTWKTNDSSTPFISVCEYETTYEYDVEKHRFKGEWLVDDYILVHSDYEVVAWMPLPKPYEPQESEDKE